MTDREMLHIASASLNAAINPFGAELSHLHAADGRELMTDADPAFDLRSQNLLPAQVFLEMRGTQRGTRHHQPADRDAALRAHPGAQHRERVSQRVPDRFVVGAFAQRREDHRPLLGEITEDDVLLRAEVAEEGAPRDPGRGHHLVDRRLLETLLQEQRQRGVHDLLLDAAARAVPQAI